MQSSGCVWLLQHSCLTNQCECCFWAQAPRALPSLDGWCSVHPLVFPHTPVQTRHPADPCRHLHISSSAAPPVTRGVWGERLCFLLHHLQVEEKEGVSLPAEMMLGVLGLGLRWTRRGGGGGRHRCRRYAHPQPLPANGKMRGWGAKKELDSTAMHRESLVIHRLTPSVRVCSCLSSQ